MTYCTLVFARARHDAVEVSENGQTKYLRREAAQAHYRETVVDPAQVEQARRQAEQEERRRVLVDNASIKSGIEVRRDSGGIRKTKIVVDTVTLDGKFYEVPAGTAHRFAVQEAKRRCPDAPESKTVRFEDWWSRSKTERRTWVAELITASSSQVIDLPQPLDWKWGFPTGAANAELDRLESEGWRLQAVSEDHGLYKGEDALEEAYPARVRYLLHRDV